MPLPYKFRSIEKWQELFARMGFASSFAHHIGFPAAGFHKPGLGIIELSVKKQEEMVIKDLIGNEIRNPKSDLNVFVESVETSI